MTILETPANHSGVERIVADGVLTPNQCRQLLDLAQVSKCMFVYIGPLEGRG